MDKDPLTWQLEQVEQLKKLAVVMGWKESSKEYKFELNRIHQQAKGEDASADNEEKVKKISWPEFKGWVRGASGTRQGRGRSTGWAAGQAPLRQVGQ